MRMMVWSNLVAKSWEVPAFNTVSSSTSCPTLKLTTVSSDMLQPTSLLAVPVRGTPLLVATVGVKERVSPTLKL